MRPASQSARCALTAPFHPCLSPRYGCEPSAVCSLWHFPSACAGFPLGTILPCGARTFLPFRGDRISLRQTAKFSMNEYGLYSNSMPPQFYPRQSSSLPRGSGPPRPLNEVRLAAPATPDRRKRVLRDRTQVHVQVLAPRQHEVGRRARPPRIATMPGDPTTPFASSCRYLMSRFSRRSITNFARPRGAAAATSSFARYPARSFSAPISARRASAPPPRCGRPPSRYLRAATRSCRRPP